jgi:RNA polymerase sigma factor (sigma-70 family)
LKNATYILDENLLWKRLKTGDKQAFSILYQRYVKILYSYGKRITRDEKLVEDSIQDLFIDLWQSRDNLGDAIAVRFYLFRSLRRKIYRSNPNRPTSPVRPHEDLDLSNIESSDYTQEDLIIGEEEAKKNSLVLHNLIRNLSIRQEEALLLYYYEGFNYTQIAELLAINEQSARNLVQRALIKLKKYATSAQSPLTIFLVTHLLTTHG